MQYREVMVLLDGGRCIWWSVRVPGAETRAWMQVSAHSTACNHRFQHDNALGACDCARNFVRETDNALRQAHTSDRIAHLVISFREAKRYTLNCVWESIED